MEERDFLLEVRAGAISLDSMVVSETRTKGGWCKLSQIPGCVKIRQEGIDERKKEKQENRALKLQEKQGRREQKALAVQQQQDALAAISDCTDRNLVQSICQQVAGILTRDETVQYLAVQKKPVVNIKPDAIVASQRRIIFYRPKMLGRFDFQDYLWRDLHDAHLSQGILGSTFTATHIDGTVVSMDYLSKESAKRLYQIAQEREEAAIEVRRERQMEESRAGAAQIAIQNNLAGDAAATNVATPQSDLTQRLMTLKHMLDGGLITQADFDQQKQKILDEV